MTCQRRQRGATTLLVMLGLLAALALGLLYAQRGVLLESRMSANQARSTTAFEAAEAGLDWTVAQLNAMQRSGPDCRADTSSTTSFRDRMTMAAPGGLTVRRAADGTPMRAACIRRSSGWACHCPVDGAATLPASDDADPVSFTVEIAASDRPGVLRVVSSAGVSGRATARGQALFALLPALPTAPAAALTARGTIGAASASARVTNDDALSAGLVLHAGGAVNLPPAQWLTTAGSSSAVAIASGDATLAGATAQRLFTAHAGLAPETWRDQPTVQRVDCRTDCAARLEAAAGSAMLWVDGDAELEAPLALGQPDRPVMLVVHGRLVVRGPVVVHGVVVADGLVWQGADGAQLNGAALSTGDIALDARVVVRRDPPILTALRQRTGSFVRVPGSWRDF